MRLQRIIKEKQELKNQYKDLMLESTIQYWDLTYTKYTAPLSESGQKDYESKMEEIIIETAFKLPMELWDTYAKVLEEGWKDWAENAADKLATFGQNVQKVKTNMIKGGLSLFGKVVPKPLKDLGAKFAAVIIQNLKKVVSAADGVIKKIATKFGIIAKDMCGETATNESLIYEAEEEKLKYEIDAEANGRALTAPEKIAINIVKQKKAGKVVTGEDALTLATNVAPALGDTELSNAVSSEKSLVDYFNSKEIRGTVKKIETAEGMDNADVGDVACGLPFTEKVIKVIEENEALNQALDKLGIDPNAFLIPTLKAASKTYGSLLMGLSSVLISVISGTAGLHLVGVVFAAALPAILVLARGIAEEMGASEKTLKYLKNAEDISKLIGNVISIGNIIHEGYKFFASPESVPTTTPENVSTTSQASADMTKQASDNAPGTTVTHSEIVTGSAISSAALKADELGFTGAGKESLLKHISKGDFTQDAFLKLSHDQQVDLLNGLKQGKLPKSSWDALVQAGGGEHASAATTTATNHATAHADTSNATAHADTSNATAAHTDTSNANAHADTSNATQSTKTFGTATSSIDELLQQNNFNTEQSNHIKELIATGKLSQDNVQSLISQGTVAGQTPDQMIAGLDKAAQAHSAATQVTPSTTDTKDYLSIQVDGDSLSKVLIDKGFDSTSIAKLIDVAKANGLEPNELANVLSNPNLHDGALKTMMDSDHLATFAHLSHEFANNSDAMNAIISKAGTGAIERVSMVADTLGKDPALFTKAITNSKFSDIINSLSDNQIKAYAEAVKEVSGYDDAVDNIINLVQANKLVGIQDAFKDVDAGLAKRFFSLDYNDIANLNVDPKSLASDLSQLQTNGVELNPETLSKLVKLNKDSLDILTGVSNDTENGKEIVSNLISKSTVDDLNNVSKMSDTLTNDYNLNAGKAIVSAQFDNVWNSDSNAVAQSMLTSKGFDEKSVKEAFDYIGSALKDKADQVDYNKVLQAMANKADSGIFDSTDPKDVVAKLFTDGKIPDEYLTDTAKAAKAVQS